MLLEINDWVKILTEVSKLSGISKKKIGADMGIAGSAMGGMMGCTTRPDPRHSEGEYLLGLYSELTNNKEVPKLFRSKDVRCGSCSVLKPRAEILRMGVQKFRCTVCIKNAETRKHG